MRFDSRFKTQVSWHIPDEAGHIILPHTAVRESESNRHHYVIKCARTHLSYLWHRFKLGKGLYLKPIPDAVQMPPTRLILRREYLFDPVTA